MNVDFRFLRQTALGVCGVALLGFLFGGCVSLHKPRFWDKDDATAASTSGGSGSQKDKKPSTDPAASTKAAPTVVAVDHSTSDDPTGHVSVFDFSDPSPTASSRQNASASVLQPARPSTSQVAGFNNDPFAPAVPQSSAAGGLASTPRVAPIAKTSAVQTKDLDPFAETSQPVVQPAAVGDATRAPGVPSAKTSKSSDAFADLGGPASIDVHAPLAQPESQPLAKPAPPPMQLAAIEPSSTPPPPPAPPQPAVPFAPVVSPQPAVPFALIVSPQPAAVQAQPAASEPALSPEPLPAMPADPQSASEGAGVPNPMICDSHSVRGRFTGADAPVGKAVYPSSSKGIQSEPSANGVPMTCTDADAFWSQPGQEEDASSHTTHGPKPLGRVVNAVAHRIGKASAADSFAFEQAVDTSVVDPISVGDGRTQPLTAHGPRPLSAEQAGDGSASAELMAAETTVAPDPPREERRINPETWFGVGIAVGLAASLALWLRLRPKNEHVLNG